MPFRLAFALLVCLGGIAAAEQLHLDAATQSKMNEIAAQAKKDSDSILDYLADSQRKLLKEIHENKPPRSLPRAISDARESSLYSDEYNIPLQAWITHMEPFMQLAAESGRYNV